MEKGDEEAEDDEIELQMAEKAVLVGGGKGVIGFGDIIAGGLEVVLGGADKVVKPLRQQRRR